MEDFGKVYEFIAHTVFWATLVSLVLPPTEYFEEYPRFRKHYELLVKLVNNYAALNLRGKIAAAYNKSRNGGQP